LFLLFFGFFNHGWTRMDTDAEMMKNPNSKIQNSEKLQASTREKTNQVAIETRYFLFHGNSHFAF